MRRRLRLSLPPFFLLLFPSLHKRSFTLRLQHNLPVLLLLTHPAPFRPSQPTASPTISRVLQQDEHQPRRLHRKRSSRFFPSLTRYALTRPLSARSPPLTSTPHPIAANAGPVFLGILLCILLLGVVLCQTVKFFSSSQSTRNHSHHPYTQLFIGFLVGSQTLKTVLDVVTIYETVRPRKQIQVYEKTLLHSLTLTRRVFVRS